MPSSLDFHTSSQAKLLLDMQMQVLACSPAAQAILHNNTDVLRLRQGRLETPHQADVLNKAAAKLKRASIAKSSSRTADQARPQGIRLFREGGLPLTAVLTLVPVREKQDETPQPELLLRLTAPQAQQLDLNLLRDLFEFTPTEARMALAIAEGMGTEQVAQHLQVQPNTVRAHVKRLLCKTGTSCKSQLVSLLWRCAAVQTRALNLPPDLRGKLNDLPKSMPVWATTNDPALTTLIQSDRSASAS